MAWAPSAVLVRLAMGMHILLVLQTRVFLSRRRQ